MTAPIASMQQCIDRQKREIDWLKGRVAELEAEREWQPIETAPECKSVFVSYINGCGKRRVVKACYFRPPLHDDCDPFEGCEKSDDEWFAPVGWYEICECHDDMPIVPTDETPTHWRPLGPPPETAYE